MNILYLDQPEYMHLGADILGFSMPGHNVIPGRVVQNQEELGDLLTETDTKAIITGLVLDTCTRGADVCQWARAIDPSMPVALYICRKDAAFGLDKAGVKREQVVEKVEAGLDAPKLLKALGL